MIAIIDYDAGNLRSVEKALQHLGHDAIITRNANDILRADKVILPGVGAFGEAMAKLNTYGLTDIIKEVAKDSTPLLGVCLGLQLLFKSSEENIGINGIGLLDGTIIRIPNNGDLKVPHVGWNSIQVDKKSKLFQGIEDGSYVYFVHSFYLQAKNIDEVAATTEYGTHIHAAVEKDNIFACQFHPEKSGDVGLKILDNFARL